MDTLLQDLRFAVRLLGKDKGFTAAAVLTLAVCLGANAALFSVVHNVLLKPLPFPHPEQLVYVYDSFPNAGATRGGASVPDYYDRQRGVSAFAAQALYNDRSFSINPGERPEQVRTMVVTPSFFSLLQREPLVGRTFTAEEGTVGREHEIVLSYGAWQRLYGGRSDAIGKSLRVNDVPYMIIGVMPRTFAFIYPDVQVWLPAAFSAEEKSDDSRYNQNWDYVARLKAGASIAQAQSQLDAIDAANYARFPQWQQLLKNVGFHVVAVPLESDLVRDVRAMLYLLWGGALFVLLLGAVNVADLALVRSRVRLREMMTRAALGASRPRLTQQLVTESLVIAAVSAVGALILGYGGLRAFGLLNLQELPRGAEIHLDAATVAVVFALAAAVGILIAVIPVVSILRTDVAGVFHEDARTGTAGQGARTLRRLLVVTQVAVAFVLLVGAGLLLASFEHVLAVDPGFTAQNVLTASIRLPAARYNDTAVAGFINRALEAIRTLPGVARAGAVDDIPLGGDYSSSVINAEGYHPRPGESILSPERTAVAPGYFEAMQIALVKGRFFTARDSADAPGAIIVDERLARHFWPNADPIGHRMYLPTSKNDIAAVTPKTKFLTVVGVVHDVAIRGIAEGDTPVGAYYFPLAQSPDHAITFVIRTIGDPNAIIGALRARIAGIDSALPVFDVETMEQRVDKALVDRRSPLMLSIAFGAVALFLSAIGIYGVLAYLVAQRRKEIGIRIALGSSYGQIFNLILREGLVVLSIGFALGLFGAIAVARALQSQLYGVGSTDPRVLAGATVVLGAVALVACLIPAGRATRVNPVVALRQE